MMTQPRYQTLFSVLFVFLYTLFATGCGGGATDSNGDIPPQDDSEPSAVESIVADTGLVIAVRVGEQAILDGSDSSTTLSGPMTYAWSFTSKPKDSTATLQNENSSSPSFTADVEGTYMVELVVTADGVSSPRAIGYVEATVSGNVTGLRVHTSYPADCAECHDGRFETVEPPFDPISGKSPNHLATSNLCAACHTTFGFNVLRPVDHQEVFGACSSCHDGIKAIGKSEFHIPTTAECDDCHTTDSFITLGPDGKFDHTDIISGCDACHNGTTAIGKNDGHTVTTAQCNSCHNTTAFIPAFVDHTNITSECSSCHGVTATGPSVGHPDMMPVECGTCHGTRTFSMGGIYDHASVSATNLACSTCHNDTNGINAPGKSIDHIITTSDCLACHNTVMFSPAFTDNNGNQIDHTSADVTNNRCDSCHDGVSVVGKHANHMPTTEDCIACHDPGGTFTTGTFDHAPAAISGVTCESCHDGLIAVGKGVFHVGTNADCGTCHLNTTSFTGAVFDHTGIVNNCASCHDGNTAIGKTQDHIPTTEDCSVCHADTNSNGFMNSTFLSTTHPGITTGCQDCHTPTILPLVSKAADHIPTTRDCVSCHTTITFIPSNFTHQGINSNCVLCHNGQHIASGATAKTANHIATNSDCSACHNTTTFVGATVDHNSPEVTSVRCDSCHDGNTALGKGQTHIATTEDCQLCHVPGSFIPAIFDHTGIVDNCASCHDGITAIGKPTVHVPTNDDCSVCHVTTGFLPATFDHVGIVDNCMSCHDGNFAQGKPVTHVATSADCGACHNTTGFIPATFDHSTISPATRCDSCHGVTALGKHALHIPTPTGMDCRDCHTTATFVGGTWDHTGVNGNCTSCHDGATATGKPNGHFVTTQECDSCHTTNRWAPANTYTHSPAGNYPGDHARALACVSCHTNNNESITYRWPNYAPACAACHAGDYDAGEHRGTLNDNKGCGDAGCHRVNARGW